MFLLGEYCDEEARFVADCLKDAGMKVDIRTYTASEVETDHFLEGRMSELLAVLTEDERQKYERYLSALRNVLAEGASEEDWSERLADEIDPHREENRERLLQLISDSRQEREKKSEEAGHVEESDQVPDATLLDEPNQAVEANQPESQSEEARTEEKSRLVKAIMDVSDAEYFAEHVIERNHFRFGEDGAALPDDPILRVYDEREDDERGAELVRSSTTFSVEPRAQVLVDEFSSLLADDLDEDFRDEYPREYSQLTLLAKIIDSLEEAPQSKEDMAAFCERSIVNMDINGNLLELDGSEAVEELARSLEKNGVIKVKGDRIKWKR